MNNAMSVVRQTTDTRHQERKVSELPRRSLSNIVWCDGFRLSSSAPAVRTVGSGVSPRLTWTSWQDIVGMKT